MRTELSRLVGSANVLEIAPGSPYNSDASRRGLRGRAELVVRPADAGEVAGVVAWCYRNDVAIVPRGGGTGVSGGAVPIDGGVVCSLERLRRVRELDPGLWRMLPEAGVSTHDVQRLARENGLMFAPDPGAGEQSQIGGNVATNAGGPHGLKYGSTGSWVTGLEVVLAPGELVELGGWASKDVAGYDLKALLVGSEGTLGVITAVRLRLLPAPEQAIPVVAFLPTLAAGCESIERVLEVGLRPSVLDFLDAATLEMLAPGYPREGRWSGDGDGRPPAGAFALVAEVDGTAEQARADGQALRELLEGEALAVHEPADARALWRWRDGINGVVTGMRGAKVSEDVVFPIERMQEGLERFEALARRHGLRSCAWGHGGEGNVHATVLVDPAREGEFAAAEAVTAELFALAVGLGGSISGEHGVGWLKRGQLQLQWNERALELHERIKQSFDPKGLLNPGKKLARYPARSPDTSI